MLIKIYRFFVIFNLLFYSSLLFWVGYVLLRNNSGLDTAGKVLIERELGIQNYKVKKYFSSYYEAFVLPVGLWWIELEQPFSPNIINHSHAGLFKYFDPRFVSIARDMAPIDYYNYEQNGLSPQQIIDDQIFRSFGVNMSGFETYIGVKVHLGETTVCYADNCNITIFAKEGDRNIVLQVRAYMTDRRIKL